jgi:hypothetical protein
MTQLDDGLLLNPYMQGEIGPVFEHACKLGLEGIVSKHRDRAYRAGRCRLRLAAPRSLPVPTGFTKSNMTAIARSCGAPNVRYRGKNRHKPDFA